MSVYEGLCICIIYYIPTCLGSLYIDACPVDSRIAVWQVAMGVCGVVVAVAWSYVLIWKWKWNFKVDGLENICNMDVTIYPVIAMSVVFGVTVLVGKKANACRQMYGCVHICDLVSE